MENKIIEQSDYGDLEIQNNTEDGIAVVWQFNENTDRIIIERDKTREAAFAICPELQQDLEKAKEFLSECSRFLNSVQAPVTPAIYLKQEITTFLENSGLNKNLK